MPGVGSDIKKPGVIEQAYTEVPVPAIQQIYALMGVTTAARTAVALGRVVTVPAKPANQLRRGVYVFLATS